MPSADLAFLSRTDIHCCPRQSDDKGVIPNSLNYNLTKPPHTQTQVKTNCVLWVFKTYLIKTSREIPCVIYNTKYYTKTSQDPVIMNDRVMVIPKVIDTLSK